MSIGIYHIAGILFTLSIIIGVGIYSGSKVKGSSDFANGGRSAGAWIVTGAILGALVGGQSTIGTAQLSFLYGLSAWWFTLGSGIGCLILMLIYAVPMRKTCKTTLMSVISAEYGPGAEYLSSVLSSIGIIISIVSNVISGCALMMTVLNIHAITAVTITVILMIVYVIFGGVWGAGMGGIVKLILLYGTSVFGLILVCMATGGPSGLMSEVDRILLTTDLGFIYKVTETSVIRHRYVNLLSRGVSKDLGSALSLIVGVLSTQTYAQGIWSARDNQQARKGALLSALLAPPVGLCCVAIGMYMRTCCITSAEAAQLTELGRSIPEGLMVIESSSQVFPLFILQHMPSFLGGMAIGTLLITVVAGGAGLALGVSVILVENIFVKRIRRPLDSRQKLFLTRGIIAGILAMVGVVAVTCSNALINDLGFLSMGLRGSVVFIPFTCALFFPGRIRPRMVLLSIVAGPLTVIAGNLIGLPFDPLFAGIGVNILCCLIGYILVNSSQKHYN